MEFPWLAFELQFLIKLKKRNYLEQYIVQIEIYVVKIRNSKNRNSSVNRRSCKFTQKTRTDENSIEYFSPVIRIRSIYIYVV